MPSTPFSVQRFPLGLPQLLSQSGGQTPTYIEQEIQGGLELLQFYALTQLQSGFANNAAAAEGTAVPLVLSADRWTVLFGVTGAVVKTATVTALFANVSLNRRTQFGQLLFASNLGPFGATET